MQARCQVHTTYYLFPSNAFSIYDSLSCRMLHSLRMKAVSFFVLFFIHHVCIIHAIAIIPQLSFQNETASLDDVVNSSLSVPDRPAGLETPTTFSQDRPLNAFNLWKSALQAIYRLALRPWDGPMPAREFIFVPKDSDVTIFVISRRGRLTTGYVITALFNTVNEMFQLQPGFFTCLTRLVLNGQDIGQVKISTESPQRSSIDNAGGLALTGNTTMNSTILIPQVDLKTPNITLNKNKDNSNNSLTFTESVTDLDDPLLRIEYVYGRAVQRSDLWTAVLDGIATSAQFDVGARCVSLTAVSISGNLAFHVNELDNYLFTYELAIRTFRLMALVSMRSRIFKELEMTVFYKDIVVAVGFVLGLGKPARVGGAEAVVSER